MKSLVKDRNSQDCAIAFSEEEFLAGKAQRLELYEKNFLLLMVNGDIKGKNYLKNYLKTSPPEIRKIIKNSAKVRLYDFKELCEKAVNERWFEVDKTSSAITKDLVLQEKITKEILIYLSKHCYEKQLIDLSLYYVFLSIEELGFSKAINAFLSDRCLLDLIECLIVHDWEEALKGSLLRKKKSLP